jgi:hypothetical protein
MQVETRIILLSSAIAIVLAIMSNHDKLAILAAKLLGVV